VIATTALIVAIQRRKRLGTRYKWWHISLIRLIIGPKILEQQSFFLAKLEHEASDEEGERQESRECVPDQHCANDRDEDTGIDRMSDDSIGAAADYLVSLLEGNLSTPEFPEMDACPRREAEPAADENQAQPIEPG
jgi:hypothetical protein